MFEVMLKTIGMMILIIIFLFLLDLIIYMLKSMLGINWKKALIGFGAGFGLMAFREWYKKNKVTAKTENIVEEVVEEQKEEEK